MTLASDDKKLNTKTIFFASVYLRVDWRLLTNFVPENEQKMVIRESRGDVTIQTHSEASYPGDPEEISA